MPKTPLSNKTLRDDLSAGLIVFLVALPLCLGIALASGAPFFSGIIAGILGGVLVGFLSGSHVSVSGPAAGLTTVVIAGIATLGSYEAFLVAVVLAGVVQILMGCGKIGSIAEYFPSAVIRGMLTAIGIIIIIKQIPHGLGYDLSVLFMDDSSVGLWADFQQALMHVHPAAMVLCIGSLALMKIWDKPAIKRRVGMFPSGLAVVIIGVALNEFVFSSLDGWAIGESHRVSIPVPGSVGEFWGLFTMPDFSFITNPDVWVVGLTIAAVASIETLLCIEAADRLDTQRRVTPTNRELMAQGVGNIASGMIGGLPITSVIVRTSANVHAGAKTKLSAIIHGVLLVLTVVAVPDLLNRIPLASLAAILLMVGYKLCHPSVFIHTYGKGYEQFLPFIATVGAIVFTDLLTGVGIGICVSVFLILRHNLTHSGYLYNDLQHEGEALVLKLSEQVSFLNNAAIRRVLDHVPPGAKLTIDTSATRYMDSDVLETICEFTDIKAPQRNIAVKMIRPIQKYKTIDSLAAAVKKKVAYRSLSIYELASVRSKDAS